MNTWNHRNAYWFRKRALMFGIRYGKNCGTFNQLAINLSRNEVETQVCHMILNDHLYSTAWKMAWKGKVIQQLEFIRDISTNFASEDYEVCKTRFINFEEILWIKLMVAENERWDESWVSFRWFSQWNTMEKKRTIVHHQPACHNQNHWQLTTLARRRSQLPRCRAVYKL